MRKAPIVVGSTAAGLGLVLSFHSHSPTISKLSVGPTAGTSTTTPTPSTTAPTPSPSDGSTTTTRPSATRTVTGQEIQYRYGDIELRVTETGSHITKVDVVRNDGVDSRSEEINSQAVPILQQQALQAQSANIDGVSGATFTSYAYAQSLQSALDQLSS